MEVKQKQYIAIDLKSFYASVECVARGVDPLKANLLVTDPSRSDQTICLAVSPALKAIGVIPAIAAVVLFVLTQDLAQPMAMFDGWSIWFAVIAIASIALRIASIRRKADDDNKEQPYAPAAA